MDKQKTANVTVIIPCWNYGMFLREAIDSVLAQTVKPYKIILADDGSTDDSYKIQVEYYESNPFLFVLDRSAKREGTIVNENKAAELVQTEWMFYLDADDKIDPTYIEKAWNIIESRKDPKLAIVYSDMLKIGLWDGIWQTSDWDPVALRTGNYINGHSFIKVSVFREIGGLRDTGAYEDHQMWVDMLDLNKDYYGVRIPEALVHYRRHDKGHRTDKSDIATRS